MSATHTFNLPGAGVFQLCLLTSHRPQLRQGLFPTISMTYLGLLGGIGKTVSAINHYPFSAALNRTIIS